MKSVILSVLFFFPVFIGNAQDITVKKKNNDLIVDIDTLTGIRNKKIIFEQDTLYIINSYGLAEFKRCAGDLAKVHDLSKTIFNLNNDISSIQYGVDSMYYNIKSLTDFINKYQKNSEQKLNDLSLNNADLNKKLESVGKELEETRQHIKAERWNSAGSKIIWGAAGFAVGGLLFTSLMILK
jgi:uncharacterized protein YeeX (DUF496 family)